VIITATGVNPVVAGKPETPLHAESITRTGARRPLVIGDRLDTDIEGAVRGGADSLLVLTGVSTALDAVLAPAIRRPTYLAADLGGLLEPQPVIGPRGHASPAAASGGTAGPVLVRCGGWQARLTSDGEPLELTGDGAWIDGLRALCAAAWSREQVSEEVAAAALKTLGEAA
jgi:hypothetical protein